jgi:hypothetical protein
MAAAARYLDTQMDAWFANGKKLRTGDGETVCISCHTALTYALARPALRRAQRAGDPGPQEARILRDVARRVEAYGSMSQAFYDANEQQKAESRGTEAVLNALILARDDDPRREAREVTAKAFGELWASQRADGAWDWLQFALEPWETTGSIYNGATLGALAVGTAPRYAADREATAGAAKLRAYLKAQYPRQSLFNRISTLLASSRFAGIMTSDQRSALTGEIRRLQRADGGWSTWSLGPWTWSRPSPPFAPPGMPDVTLLDKSDALATGLVVSALRETGTSPDDPLVAKGLDWLRSNMQRVEIADRPHAAWRAYSLNHDREHGGPRGVAWRQMFMSNAATAFAVLALAGPDCSAATPRC